jgi:hypothetical protein
VGERGAINLLRGPASGLYPQRYADLAQGGLSQQWLSGRSHDPGHKKDSKLGKRTFMAKSLRKMSLVRLKKRWAEDPATKKAPFFGDQPLVFLGEIPNMPEHGVFVGQHSGKIYSGIHISQFTELNEDET